MFPDPMDKRVPLEKSDLLVKLDLKAYKVLSDLVVLLVSLELRVTEAMPVFLDLRVKLVKKVFVV